MPAKAVSQDVLAVLSAAETEGDKLRITTQLDRQLYTQVNKTLVTMGGQWNRSAKAHIFDGDVSDILDQVLLTGTVVDTKQEFGQFDTPEALAAELVRRADISPDMSVLEPSAGIGRIATAARQAGGDVHCNEIDPKRIAVLKQNFDVVHENDFLGVQPVAQFDRVVMNPPFARGADIAHIRHAYGFLKPGGRLVAIASPGFTFRSDRRHTEFRDWVEDRGGVVTHLPEGAFLESGTGVNTVILTLEA